MTTKTVVVRLVLVALAVLVPLTVVRSLPGPAVNQSGFIVSGDVDVFIYEADGETLVENINWGNISLNVVNARFFLVKVSENVRVNYWSDDPTDLNVELFYESTPNHWGRWSNNTLLYFNREWTRIMLRLTALSGAAGPFSFYSYFDAI